jgi:hypothetical protein
MSPRIWIETIWRLPFPAILWRMASVLGLVAVPYEKLTGLHVPDGERQREDRVAIALA